MLTYVLRKLFYMPFILFGVIALTFMLFTISTKPEALATIQLGEKATSRSKYEWLKSKGYIAWTPRGQEKLVKMDKGDLPTFTTNLFNASTINEIAKARDELEQRKLEVVEIPADSAEGTAARAEYANKVFANREKTKALLSSARVTHVVERLGPANAGRARGAERVVMELESAQFTLDQARVLGSASDVADAEKVAAQAAAALQKLQSESTEVATASVAAAKALPAVEDIEPDLEYTSVVTVFGSYVKDLLTLEFGDTRNGREVSQVLREGMWPSLSLALPAFLLAELIALFFGLLAAMYRKSKLDSGIVISSIVLMSLNGIAIIIAGQKFMASDWNYFPISGYAGGFGAVRYLLLPAFLYVVLSFGEHVRFNRIVMLDEVGQDYVRTARAKGLNENTVLFKHVLRNSLIPLITRWVVAIPTLYTGALILESFFGIPGLGYLTVDAIANSDGNVIRAIVFIGAVSFMLANLLSDMLYAVADPRIRLG